MKDLIPLTIGAILGGTVSLFAQSYVDPFNVTDAKECAKNMAGAGMFADHESLVTDPEYRKAYKWCKGIDQ